MKRPCEICSQPFKDGDRVKAVVLSVYREISSSVTYAIETPYECLSLAHLRCAGDDE